MKPILVEFVGGPLDGKTLCTDSSDREEMWLATACYEMSHHGAIGEECGPLCDATDFAQRHGWLAAKTIYLHDQTRYLVAERRETKSGVFITFEFDPLTNASLPLSSTK